MASAEPGPGRRTRARAAFRKVNDLWLVYYLGTREKSENLGPSQGNRNLKMRSLDLFFAARITKLLLH